MLLFRVVFVNCLALCQPLLWQIRMDQVDRVVRLKGKNIQLMPGLHRIYPISWDSIRYGRPWSFLYCIYTNAPIAPGDGLWAIAINRMEKVWAIRMIAWKPGQRMVVSLLYWSRKEALIGNEILSWWVELPQQLQWAYEPVNQCAPFMFMLKSWKY